MSVSLWMDKKFHTQKTTLPFDIVVIGGGIAGLSAAYWLHQADTSMKIAVVEKNLLGDGATGRNAGFITCGSVEHFNRLERGRFGHLSSLEHLLFNQFELKCRNEWSRNGQVLVKTFCL